MGHETTALAVTTLIFSLIIAWESILSMIRKKDVWAFLPFFFMSVALTIYAGFILFELFFNWTWFFLESLILFNLIWILIIIRRQNGHN